MSRDLVFNETSIPLHLTSSIDVVWEWLGTLRKTLQSAENCNTPRIFRVAQDFNITPFTVDYSFNDYIFDGRVDRDERIYWISSVTKISYLDNTPQPLYQKFLETECVFDETIGDSQGLKCAFLLEGLAVSFASSDVWNSDNLLVNINEIDQTGEITTYRQVIKHAINEEHINTHCDWLRGPLNLWQLYSLPQVGDRVYQPPTSWRIGQPFPKRRDAIGEVGFLDKDRNIWIWDNAERHWDVQNFPYKRDNYERITSDGRVLP